MSKRNIAGNEKGSDACKWTEIDQKRLSDLVEKGTITLYDSAVKVKDCHESFERFSNSVVGYHLGVLRKQKYKCDSDRRSSQTGIIPPVNDVLTELKVVPHNTSSASLNVSTADVSSGSYDLIYENMPFLRYSYMQYDTKQEKLVVMLDLPGGTADYDWEFNEYGDSIKIVANWSKAVYDVQNLYQKSLQDKLITLEHPKLHAMQNEVMRQGFSSKNIPKYRIQVDLGKRVHKDDGTWTLDVIQHEGNKILLFEFSGFQEDVLKIEKRGKFT